MGRYITFANIADVRTIRTNTGTDSQGRIVRIELWKRPVASTKGITYLSTWVNGVGVSTEQFSGERNKLVATLYDGLVAALAASTEAKGKAAAKVSAVKSEELFAVNGVQVFVQRGKGACYRIFVNGAQHGSDIAFGSDWRAVRASTIATAEKLAGVA